MGTAAIKEGRARRTLLGRATEHAAMLARRVTDTGVRTAPTLIVGAGAFGEEMVGRLPDGENYAPAIATLGIDPRWRAERAPRPFTPVPGGLEELAHAVGRTGARDVVVAARTEQEAAVAEAVERCRRLGLRASVASCHPESLRHIAAVHNLTGLRLPSFPTARAPWRMTVKHAVDRVIALIALVLLGPLLLAIGFGVWLSSPGPAVFRQRRVGRDGREFEVLKFRTMFEDDGGCEFAPGEGLAPGGVEGADRRTRFGRWLRSVSLDELPQLVNVLRGDMSLVGPRPERPEFVTRFTREVSHYQDRHRMKSGITGWAQVNGLRGQTSIAARVELDNHYIRNWSLWLDLRILALTVAEIMGLRG